MLPSAHTIRQFAYFNLGGTAFFVIGYALFTLLYGVFGTTWWIAKIVADCIGWTINYLVQRHIAFAEESKNHTEKVLLGKFTVISVANVPIDYAIVGGLKMLGVSPFIGLFVSATFFTVWKWLWYKYWVFRHPKVAL